MPWWCVFLGTRAVTDTPTDIARPARRRTRAPTRAQASVQKQATDTAMKALDRFGLAPILLLGLAYVGHTQVIQPIAAAYANMVQKVGENNELLRNAVDSNNKEDEVRVKAISAAQALNQQLAEANKELNQKILDATATAAEERRKIHAETQALLERVEKLLSKRGE